MSQPEPDILGFTTQDLIRWSLVLLLIVAGFGSILEGGALSGAYNQTQLMVYIPVLLFMYFGILASLIALGLEPNKFEMIFIPVVLIVMIVLAMSFANIIPPVQSDDDGDDGSVTSIDDGQIGRSDPPGVSDPPGNNFNDTFYASPNGDNLWDQIIANLWQPALIILTLLLLGMLLYWLVNRKEFDPDIQIHKVNEYTKSAFETNNTIIEYYVDASKKIETLKGRAPHWFSPTKFSGHVTESPGPPLSSYFDKITAIYEMARFGEKKMTQEDVEEVKELHHQVINQVEMILKQLRNQEVKEE